MATTMAAGICAQRLYLGTRLAPDGGVTLTDDEDAIQSFVKEDFMGK
jgi:taspase (threonine aspartase 1)